MCLVTQSCPTLCDPTDCSQRGSSVHGIFQARVLEWLPFPPPGDLSDPGIETASPVSPKLAGRFFTTEPPGNPYTNKTPYLPKYFSTSLCIHYIWKKHTMKTWVTQLKQKQIKIQQYQSDTHDYRFDPWVGKIPWRRERLPTPVFWPGEFHGLYTPWVHKESNRTEWLSLSCMTTLSKVNKVIIYRADLRLKRLSTYACNLRSTCKEIALSC